METSYRVRNGRLVVVLISDGQHNAPRGVLGGQDGCLAETHVITDDVSEEKIPNFHIGLLDSSSVIRGRTNSGGGYGDPRTRDPKLVLEDVLEGWESIERARDVYAVAFQGRIDDETLSIDLPATEALRREGVYSARSG